MSLKILGVFDDATKASRAIAAVHGGELGKVTAFSPAPDHAIDGAFQTDVSAVRTFTLVGGLLGCATGFAFPIYTVLDWPLIVGGKPLISIPPFVVIAFELTILFGAISGLIGFLLLSGLPRIFSQVPDDPRFTNDRFGVLVMCDKQQADAVRVHLERAGAEEIEYHA